MATNTKKIKVILELSLDQEVLDQNYINRLIHSKLVLIAQDPLLNVVEARYSVHLTGGDGG